MKKTGSGQELLDNSMRKLFLGSFSWRERIVERKVKEDGKQSSNFTASQEMVEVQALQECSQ